MLGSGAPQSALIRLRSSGADTLMIFVTPTPTIQGYAVLRGLNWKPANIYVNSVSATDTFMGPAVARSSARDRQRVDQRPVPEGSGVARLGERRDGEAVPDADGEVQPERANVTDGLNFYGFAKADTFVRAMYKAGKNPTRAGLMRALLSFNETSPFLLPGSKLKTSATDHFIISHQRLMTFNNGVWTGLRRTRRRAAARLVRRRKMG